LTSQLALQNNRLAWVIPWLLTLFVLATPVSNYVTNSAYAWNPNEPQNRTTENTFSPLNNVDFVDAVESDLLEIPVNHTVTEANLSLSSFWNPISYDNTTFGSNESASWNGTLSNVIINQQSQHITIEQEKTANIIDDFETAVAVPSGGWLTNGPDGDIWTIVANNTSIVSNSNMILPNSGFGNSSFLSTTGRGDLTENQRACITSPVIDVPRVINNYSLSFNHWLALDVSDNISLRYLNEYDIWTDLPFPSSVAPNTNNTQWQAINISLDHHFSQSLTSTYVEFCVETSPQPILRGGWFIDELELYNQGDERGAWFHGNFSGDYLPLAISEFIIPANLTNFPYLDELEINLNWDIQGYLYDYLTVDFSFDNGQSWNTISGTYGIPGLGIWHNGNLYYAESRGWVPVYLPIVHNFTNFGGLNHTLFKFTVYTNAGVNYGGSSSSDWEGIAIDHLVFHQNRGTSNSQRLLFKDFNTAPVVGLNSSDGWLRNGSTTPNQWQWTQSMGLSAEQYQKFSFDEFDTLPLGWAVSAQDNNQWEHGEIPSRAIYGPDAWNSGAFGIGIALDGRYTNEMYTHLVSPEYSIPSNASSRLSFNSWVCTEANWDGGAISVSTDGGINWWLLPAQIGAFHDQISTANTNSPFYGEGIFDGSAVAGGCRNSSLPFQLKHYDISNLSGQDVRFRYSFFSDQLVELDGWYLDDAGIEIDLFKDSGTWLSQPIYPDQNFGWAQVDGLVDEPQGTNVLFDIIDTVSGLAIDGYSNRSLPIKLEFNEFEYPSIQIRAKLTTMDAYVTPTIKKLEMGVASYFDWYHAQHTPYGTTSTQILSTDISGAVISNSQIDLAFNIPSTCPSVDAKIITKGSNISYDSQYYLFEYDFSSNDLVTSEFANTNSLPTLADNITISMDSSSALDYFRYMPHCVLPTSNITLGLIDSSNQIYSDPPTSNYESLFATQSFSSVEIDGINYLPDNDGNYHVILQANQTLNLSYALLNHISQTDDADNTGLSISAQIESSAAGELLFHDSNQLAVGYLPGKYGYSILTGSDCNHHNGPVLAVGTNVAFSTCQLSLYANSDIYLAISKFSAISSVSEFNLELDALYVNALKQQIENTTNQSVIDLPVVVSTDYGSITTAFSYRSYLHQIDRIEYIDKQQWLPGQEITIQTSHVRFNPITMSENNFIIDNVELVAATDSTRTGAQFIIQATDLYANEPEISVLYGTEKVSVNSAKSLVSCNEGYCLINWTLQSTWHLDDADDVAWMVKSTDNQGLQTGPAIVVRETQFNEIENDLEVFELNAFDESNNRISDWTNQNWPYRLSQQHNIIVSGAVRFEGITDVELSQNDAEIEIRLTAIPPQNLSGGDNEWSSQAINWTVSHFTELQDSGLFSGQISAPSYDEVPTNTTIQLSVHISRVGPPSSSNEYSTDRTSPNMKTRFIFDISQPSVTSISIYDPAGLTPADGHIWTLNQDIPIQVILEDIEGLSTELVVYTWAEYADDKNGDSVMDQAEYRTTTVSVNYAANIAVLDIPAISWQEVKGPFESGKLSIVLSIRDLAGNELLNGGDFGEQNDAATIIVQDQLQTLMDSSVLGLDLVNDNILPSYQHTFTYSITDYNGINSLDKLSLALIGRDSPNDCFIDFYPRFAAVEYDQSCFENQPIIEVEKSPGVQKWSIKMKFIISWSAVQSTPNLSGIPSLKVFDDGQDLQLGTSYIRGLSWSVDSNISLGNIDFLDMVEPTGVSSETSIWVNPMDKVIISSNLIHHGTNIVIGSLSPYDDIGCLVNNQNQPIENVRFDDGQLVCEFEVPSDTDTNNYPVELWVLSNNSSSYYTQTGTIYIDDANPLLNLEIKDLLRLNSNKLSQVLFSGSITENTSLISNNLTVNWNIISEGFIVNNQAFSSNISLIKESGQEYRFTGLVNLTNIGNHSILEGDEIEIWLSLQDNSGQNLIGFATENERLLPRITWYDFDPKISLVELRTTDPTDGESLMIATRIVNAGLESGNATITISDASGKVLDSKTTELDGGKWQLIEWQIEAWTTGNIEIIVAIENYSQTESLIIQDVKEFESKQQDLMGTVGLVVIFLIIVVGGFSYAYLQRTKELEEYTKHHRNQIAIRKLQIQESEKEINEASQEE